MEREEKKDYEEEKKDCGGEDKSEIEDIDLLDMLNDEEGIEEVEEDNGLGKLESGGVEDFEDLEAMFMRELANGVSDHDGTGDVYEDLLSWLNDEEKLPSSPLVSYMGNFKVKMRCALYFYHLNNLSRAKNLSEYLRVSESLLFDKDDIPTMDTEELKTRYAQGLRTLGDIMEQSRRILHLFEKDLKTDKDDSIDKLRILLGSMPSHKIKEMFKYLK